MSCEHPTIGDMETVLNAAETYGIDPTVRSIDDLGNKTGSDHPSYKFLQGYLGHRPQLTRSAYLSSVCKIMMDEILLQTKQKVKERSIPNPISKQPSGEPGTTANPPNAGSAENQKTDRAVCPSTSGESSVNENPIKRTIHGEMPGQKGLRQIQDEVGEWSHDNFGEQQSCITGQELGSLAPLMGLAEEVGELFHATLKAHQGIRDFRNPAHYQAKRNDAIGDILVYLCDYASREGIDLFLILNQVWKHVGGRDWKAHPNNASVMAPVPEFESIRADGRTPAQHREHVEQQVRAAQDIADSVLRTKDIQG